MKKKKKHILNLTKKNFHESPSIDWYNKKDKERKPWGGGSTLNIYIYFKNGQDLPNVVLPLLEGTE